jgi:fido (protein-threonine AMPylation protein)
MKIIEPTDEELDEFLRESNAIEREYTEGALFDAKKSWIVGVLNFKKDFSIDLICGIHRRLARNINKKIAGHIRTVPVYVGNRYEYRECLKPELIKDKLEKLIKTWNDQRENLKEMPKSTREDFIRKWHIDFEGIHPFEDFNGRTGRILMNLQRLSVGLPILIIHEGTEQFLYYRWFKEDLDT